MPILLTKSYKYGMNLVGRYHNMFELENLVFIVTLVVGLVAGYFFGKWRWRVRVIGGFRKP